MAAAATCCLIFPHTAKFSLSVSYIGLYK